MKTVENFKKIERHGVVDRKECTLSANAHMFRLLARQYANPIKAIVQEISANCFDSHVRAGKADVPFLVSLPNRLDPHIRFRDYGVSMSKKVVDEIYTGYGESDKRQTNGEVGCFGIGSKTPLAYTDSFNITTYLDGTMTMYTLAYNEAGTPELNTYGSWDTDEENGVEISFSVKESDWDKFYSAAKHVFSFYDIHPQVDGRKDYAAQTYPVKYSGEGWKIVDNSSSYVIMGNIAYPIDIYHFPYEIRKVLGLNLHFTLPIGEIDITPSRENLEYTDKTISAISKRVEEIVEDVKDQMNVTINSARSEYHATNIIYNLGSYFKNAISFNTSKWKNISNTVCFSKLPLYKYHTNYRNRVSRKAANLSNRESIVSNTLFVIKDIDNGFQSRSKKFVEDTGRTVVLFDSDTFTKAELMTKLGAVDEDNVVMLASELPEPPKVKRTYNGPRKQKKTRTLKVFKPDGRSADRTARWGSGFWEYQEIDVKKGEYVYVDLHNLKTYLDIDNRQSVDASNIANIFSLFTNPPTIIGLAAKDSKLKERKNFTSFLSWSHDQAKKLATKDMIDSVSKMDAYSTISNSNKLEKLSELTRKNNILFDSSKSDMYLFLSKLSCKDNKKAKKFVDFCNLIDYNYSEKSSKGSDLLEMEKKCKNKYPIVFHAIDNEYTWSMNKKFVKMIVDTVNLIDKYGE